MKKIMSELVQETIYHWNWLINKRVSIQGKNLSQPEDIKLIGVKKPLQIYNGGKIKILHCT